MPKNLSSRVDKSRYHAYKQLSKQGKGHDVTEGDVAESSTGKRDWEEATCPICMDYPHNAVLLFCSSHDKGCRPYMCNTSYRHSNCLDQYHKAHLGAQKTHVSREPLPDTVQSADRRAGGHSNARTNRRNGILNGTGGPVEALALDLDTTLLGEDDRTDVSEPPVASQSSLKGDIKGLLCPLCRGKVKGWKVVQSAREHLNHKVRNCAQESCSFSGNYEELRVHARREHPLARPSEVDPDRQRDWRRLERRRDLGDVLSTIHSAMPGVTVVGDFAIDDDLEEEEEGMDFPGDDGHWWTVFLLFQVFGPANAIASEGMNASRMRSRLRVPRRGLWGESLSRNNETMEIDSSSESSDSAELMRRVVRRQRNRRRAEG